MRSANFRALLRHVFRASLSAPIVLAACGGVAITTEGDGGAVDSGPIVHGRSGGCSTVLPDGGALCSYQLPLQGDPAACGLTTAATNDPTLCQDLCHQGSSCHLVQTAVGNYVQCSSPCGTGRRPEGFAPPATPRSGCAPSVVGRWWAEVAALEAASVDAFAILRAELVAHGAPKRLVRAAERAARDEVRHARVTGAIARRHGAPPRRTRVARGAARGTRVARGAARPLESIATENAVEGCVRETFGALVAMWQARSAADPRVRGAMKAIAADEARHAELAWQVARWLDTKLDVDARQRVRAARAAAIADLRAQMSRAPATALVEHAGIPSAPAAAVLLDNAAHLLWNAA